MIFIKPKNNQRYLKTLLFGEAGTGKTTFAERIAIGLANTPGNTNKKVIIIDTEGGFDFYFQHLENEGIDAFGCQVNFSKFDIFANTLKKAVAGKPNSIIIDSISFFGEMLAEEEVYSKPKKDHIPGWGVVKKKWRQHVVDVIKQAQCHIIICGQQGGTLAIVEKTQEEIEEATKHNNIDPKYISKTKIVQKDTIPVQNGLRIDYEVNLLFHMSIGLDTETGKKCRIAKVMKDRSNTIDDMEFINATAENIAPHIKQLSKEQPQFNEQPQFDEQQQFDTFKNQIIQAPTKEELTKVGKKIGQSSSLSPEEKEGLKGCYEEKLLFFLK